MVLKVYGYTQSAATKLVAAVLREKNIPYKLVLVDMTKGEHKSPENLAKQPFGQVPYIDDDGFTIYEARAIARYIEKKHPNQGTKLIPDDLKSHALFEQAASVDSANFSPPVAGILKEKFFKKYSGKETDEAAYQAHRASLDDNLKVYDNILGKQKYIAGNEVTLVDFFHLPYATLLYAAGDGDLIDKKPNVKRWFDEISSRPSWQAVKDGVEGTA